MDDHDRTRLNILEKQVTRLISLVAAGVAIGAAALVLHVATKDWGLSHTVAVAIAIVAALAAFLWLVIDFQRLEK